MGEDCSLHFDIPCNELLFHKSHPDLKIGTTMHPPRHYKYPPADIPTALLKGGADAEVKDGKGFTALQVKGGGMRALS